MTTNKPSDQDCLDDLETILQEALFIKLTGQTPNDVRGKLQRHNYLSKQVQFLYEIVDCISGSYTDEGVRRWFQRERTVLGGKSPLQYLGQGWSPDDEDAKYVLELARSTINPGAT